MDKKRLDEILTNQLESALVGTDLPDLGKRSLGRVRDSYVDGGSRALVVTDRLHAFDTVIGTIPFKGQVLNQVAQYWFEETADIAPNHLVSVPDPNCMIVRECRPLAAEFIMRAYLTGITSTSIWGAYERGEREFCGHQLPDGMRKNEKLPEALLTPSTRAPEGEHDVSVAPAKLVEMGLVTDEQLARANEMVAALFAFGQKRAAERGLILVDSKYELGVAMTGELLVIDEMHTPGSSRLWYADSYEARHASGEEPESLNQEFVRRWLIEGAGFDGRGEPPDLPDEIRIQAARRYIATYELITGRQFEPDTDEPLERIARNLGCI